MIAKFDAWVQAPDFSSLDFESIDLRSALLLYENHDWKSASEFEARLAEQDEDYCPPGIGFIHPDGHCLTIYQRDEESTSWVTFTLNTGRRFLGLIPWPKREYSSDEFPKSEVPKLISEFFKAHGRSFPRLTSLNS